MELIKQFRIAFTLVIFFTVVTGMLYPAIVTGVAQYVFPWRANGSIVFQDNLSIGSELIGQSFQTPEYFWGRPSATTPFPYNSESSSGSNWSSTNRNFLTVVKSRIQLLQQVDSLNHDPIPVDLVTASGSGLDPDISPLAARYQERRIAKIRKLPVEQIDALVIKLAKGRFLGILGEPRVNVLQLNLALDVLDMSLHHHKGG